MTAWGREPVEVASEIGKGDKTEHDGESQLQQTNLLLWPCPTLGLIWLLQLHHSSLAQLWSLATYSGHGCADTPPLSMTLGLIPIQSLLHFSINPVSYVSLYLVLCIIFGLISFGCNWTDCCRGGLGAAAASGEACLTQGLLEVWQSSQGLWRLEEVGRE